MRAGRTGLRISRKYTVRQIRLRGVRKLQRASADARAQGPGISAGPAAGCRQFPQAAPNVLQCQAPVCTFCATETDTGLKRLELRLSLPGAGVVGGVELHYCGGSSYRCKSMTAQQLRLRAKGRPCHGRGKQASARQAGERTLRYKSWSAAGRPPAAGQSGCRCRPAAPHTHGVAKKPQAGSGARSARL